MAHPLIEQFKGKLIVSCQAYVGEPMRHPETMAQMALAAEQGGAAAIRCQGLSDISAIKGQCVVPILGIWKEGHEGVYITPTFRHAKACSLAGADIVCLDATDRPRPGGETFEEIIAKCKADGILTMADCSCIEDIKRGLAAGCDIVSTTMAGYVPGGREKTEGPDYELLKEALAIAGDTPVICEGRIHTPEQAAKAIECGAWACVVGTAITHPTSITSWFVDAIG